MIARAGLPKFAGETGSPARRRIQAIVNGAIAHFGSYWRTRRHHVPHRHLDLSELGRHRAEARLQLAGDTSSYTVGDASVGGGAATLVWKRAK